MSVILIIPPALFLEKPRLNPQLGVMYLSAYLKQHGIEVKVCDLLADEQYLETVANIEKADFYGISFMTPQYQEANEIACLLKEIRPESKTVGGGAHVTSLPLDSLRNMRFDYLVLDEGERSFLDLVRGKPLEEISGLCYRNNSNSLRNHRVENLDSFPFPDRKCVPEYDQKVQGKKSTSIITARGCPYNCAFCSKVLWGQTVRYRSAENVLKEIKTLADKYKAFVFLDETFTLNKKRLGKILRGLKQYNITFRCWTRTDFVDGDLLQEMKNAGCEQIEFGIESGSQKMLNKMNKKTTLRQNKDAIWNAKKRGIYTKAYLLLGFPGETRETINKTKSFIKETKPDQVLISSFVPLPGSAVWNNPKKYGVTIKNNFSEYYQSGLDGRGGSPCEISTLTQVEMIKERDEFYEFLKYEGITSSI